MSPDQSISTATTKAAFDPLCLLLQGSISHQDLANIDITSKDIQEKFDEGFPFEVIAYSSESNFEHDIGTCIGRVSVSGILNSRNVQNIISGHLDSFKIIAYMKGVERSPSINLHPSVKQ
jgi:hypothetical protein